MVSKKYVGDYRLENVPDRRGKLKTVPVYRGPLFRFKAGEQTLKTAKRRLILLTALATAALLAAMLLRSEILSRIYIVMPLVLSILPAVLLWMGIYDLLTAGDSVRRDQSDRIQNRLTGWSVVLTVLSAFSLIGQITAYLGSADAGGIPVTVCTVVMLLCGAFIFRRKKDLQMEEVLSVQ